LSENDPLGPMLAESNKPKEEDDVWKGFSYEQEIYLKKLVIKNTIEEELQKFSQNPQIKILEQECVFLNYIYRKCLKEHPLFREKWDKIKPSLDYVIEQVPRFLKLRQSATKSRSGFLVDVFDIRILSSQEIKWNPQVRNHLVDEISSPEEKMKQAEKLKNQLDLLSLRRETFFLLQSVLEGVLEYQNADDLYSKLSHAKSMNDLSIPYRKLLGATYVFPLFYYYIHDPRTLSKIKKVQALTPTSALKGLFTVSSPASVFQKLFSLILTRPLGAKSVFQRFIELTLELQKTEEHLKEKQSTMKNKDVCDKVHNWIETNYTPALFRVRSHHPFLTYLLITPFLHLITYFRIN